MYRVSYDDLNLDGQVDERELPDFETAAQNSASGDRIRDIRAEQGGTPTQEDIDRVKQELLDNPSLPSGAYAIIKQGADGSITVLDVFAVRDWPEQSTSENRDASPPEIPALPPFDVEKSSPELPLQQPHTRSDEQPEQDGSDETHAPAIPHPGASDSTFRIQTERESVDEPHLNGPWNARWDSQQRFNATEGTRFAGTGLLMGTLWLLARQRDKLQCATTPKAEFSEEEASRPQWDFSRRARRQRKLDEQ